MLGKARNYNPTWQQDNVPRVVAIAVILKELEEIEHKKIKRK